MLYNKVKNRWGVDDMTRENYISYLVGTVTGYPAKLQRHLKNSLLMPASQFQMSR